MDNRGHAGTPAMMKQYEENETAMCTEVVINDENKAMSLLTPEVRVFLQALSLSSYQKLEEKG